MQVEWERDAQNRACGWRPRRGHAAWPAITPVVQGLYNLATVLLLPFELAVSLIFSSTSPAASHALK